MTATNPDPGEVSIDAVYTWVDSGAEGFRQEFEQARKLRPPAASSDALQPYRFRQSDELRYSLRSMVQFLPWIRNVYLVTNGQHPEWLNLECPRLQLVSHQDIFMDAGHLPTFNSNAIEMHLHRIPGVSRKFIYFNDDLFIGRTCQPRDYFSAGADICYLENIDLPGQLDPENVGDLACSATLHEMAGRIPGITLSHMPAHVPQLYDREWLHELERELPDAFARTAANRFRSPDDFILRIAYATLALAKGNHARLLRSGKGEYSLIRLKPDPILCLRDLKSVFSRRPRFFCINDELPAGWRAQLAGWVMRRFLQSCFPRPCEFESR